jgi:hypothetical protein
MYWDGQIKEDKVGIYKMHGKYGKCKIVDHKYEGTRVGGVEVGE